ncbi:Ribosomal L1 domain-containing protein 1 [Hondaea fermentalgiana]|uniref:Ribosomal L1 domain-containing protein 1 n=1 Tax=Hondaea fermentalgiana TaxID=2315210 RepID=A0A2R5GIM7_9STRA|nr:Ribosomal L1 domain-containing protein 1 [Hondaea fermentalgiana]|eukprot:GBG30742.1 Ribosomal L1 domain-containing protein 1 [Hondaea fermentalgiana]
MAKVSAPKSVEAAKMAGLPVKNKSKGAGKRAAPTPKVERKKRAEEAEAAKTAKADKKIEKKTESSHEERLAQASEKVNPDQVLRAAQALSKHVKLHRKKVREERKKRDLLDDDDEDDGPLDDKDLEASYDSKDIVFVNFALKRAAPGTKLSYKMHKIPIRHPMSKLGSDRDICVFVKDKAEAEKLFESNPIPGVKKIISLQQVRTQYSRFQARRDLAAMYDSFLADDRIICMLPTALGKRSFYNTSKRPTPINLVTKGAVAGTLSGRAERSLASAYFSFQGTLTSVRTALIKMDPEMISDNIMDVIAGSVPRLPGGWDNLLSIHIKTGNSAALPVYATTPDSTASEATAPAATPDKSKKKRKASEAEAEVEAEGAATSAKDDDKEAAAVRTPAKSAKKKPAAKSTTKKPVASAKKSTKKARKA